jgi:uncharacterized protein
MRIGIIADTHNFLPAAVFDVFSGVDQIIHAGDIGDERIMTELKTIAPVRAVYGNMDRFPLVSQFRRMEFFSLENYRFCLTHIIVNHKAFSYELYKMNKQVDVVIHGHTHRPEKERYNQILFINPGSASQPRGLSRASVGLLSIRQDKVDFEIVYLDLK